MMFEREQYSVDCAEESEVTTMSGVMRLASPTAYEAPFAPLRARIVSGRPATSDLVNVSFMNSSGIRALAGLVLLAKTHGTALRIIASSKIPWQRKTVASLRATNPGLTVELR